MHLSSIKLPSGKTLQQLLDSLPSDRNILNVRAEYQDVRFIAEMLNQLAAQEPHTYVREVHDGWPEYNKSNEFSDGDGLGTPLFKNEINGTCISFSVGLPARSNTWNPTTA